MAFHCFCCVWFHFFFFIRMQSPTLWVGIFQVLFFSSAQSSILWRHLSPFFPVSHI